MNKDTLKLDIQGHRGCRGLLPENTIPAFEKAIKLGVHTLECDVVISKDLKVIVSHEPFMSHLISTGPNEVEITEANETAHNIFELNYEALKSYDVGTKFYKRFEHQEKMRVHKPSLEDVVLATNKLDPNILFNIEIKRKTKWDITHHPDYQTFADIVVNTILDLKIDKRTTVQCFDIETLQYIRSVYPSIKLVLLIDNEKSPDQNLEELGFIPEVYSPNFSLVNAHLIQLCNAKNITVIPWTVNEVKDMKSLIDLGVHGIITDYPDRLINLLKE